MNAAVTTPTSRLAALESGGASIIMAGLEDTIRQLWPTFKSRVDTLEERKRLLLNQLEDLEVELEKARQEFAAIESAAKTLNANLSLDLDTHVEQRPYFSTLYKYGDVPIKQAARLTLAEFPGGLTSHDLFSRLSRRYFEDRLERTSFSPQLSRLKADGEVVSAQRGWVLTEKGREIMAQGRILPYRDEPDREE
ncbi:hypothetical protein [Methylobacterium fujisawaense]|uniref:hypothetical protein n=1 Tax=Methylobacterium fujisawaense TaxID=107400 RepID=UPI00244A51C8|nr:hypothetical protein [Methylobacterium fujisawaense]MDH3027939.1 hypothetical protein [Methylobacterium fujisawaense]